MPSLSQKEAVGEERFQVSAGEIVIGPYTISPMKTWDNKDAFFLRHESGEGMEVSQASLIDLIDKFYKENF